jgi:multiple sugar transport system permease protein
LLINRLNQGLRASFICIIALSTLFPLAWMAISGFKSQTEVLISPFQYFPDVWMFSNYVKILNDPTFIRAMITTFVGATIFTLLSLTLSTLAAYAFARLEFRGKQFWWIFCIIPLFVPYMAILLTSFVVVSKLGILDTYAVLIIPGAAQAFSLFFLRQYYLAIPLATEEAALIDGASRWQIFRYIFFPQSAGPLTVMGFATFLLYWNSYVWPILTISNPTMMTIQQYLGAFRSSRGNEWGLLMAGSTLAALPTIILVLIFQRFIVNGVRIAGIK